MIYSKIHMISQGPPSSQNTLLKKKKTGRLKICYKSTVTETSIKFGTSMKTDVQTDGVGGRTQEDATADVLR